MNVKDWVRLKLLEKTASVKNDALLGALIGGSVAYGGAKTYNKLTKTVEKLVNSNEKKPKMSTGKINLMLALGAGAATGAGTTAAYSSIKRKLLARRAK